MSTALLRQFYNRIAPLLASANRLRLAQLAKDSAAARTAANQFISVGESFRDEITDRRAFGNQKTDWQITQAVWNHGGRLGPEPESPQWPSRIPRFHEALLAVRWIELICDASQDTIERVDRGTFESSVRRGIGEHVTDCMIELAKNLDALQQLLEAPEDDESDGPIDRNRLAKLLNLKPKTLANRASELPDPIARDSMNVPIYHYLAAKHALTIMYPNRAFLLPSYKEAKEMDLS